MKYGSVCSGIEAITCAKCGGNRSSEGLARVSLRKHGKPDWCQRCYSRFSQSVRNSRVSPETKRKWNVSTRYGLSVPEVEVMLERQGGVCAICKEIPSGKYHIDHCHETGRVRGILCHGCNLKLPIVENEETLAAALRYLGKERAE